MANDKGHMSTYGHENSPVMGASLHIVSETYSVCFDGLVDLHPAALYDQFNDIINLRHRDGMCVFSRTFSLLVPSKLDMWWM